MMYKLSPSSLNLFIECKLCFYLAVKEGIRRPSVPFPSITSGLDSVIKKYFDSHRKKGQLPPFLEGRINGKLIDFLPKTLKFSSRGNILYGKLDECVELFSGDFAPLDHKTRASSPEEIHPSFQLQMDIYTLLLEKNGYKTKRVAYLVYYFPIPGELHRGFPFEIEVKEISTNPEEAEKIFYEAIDCLSEKVPLSNENCEYCKWVDDYTNFLGKSLKLSIATEAEKIKNIRHSLTTHDKEKGKKTTPKSEIDLFSLDFSDD